MDRTGSSPEHDSPDLLRTAFDRGIRLVVTYGAIDAEYERPHNEQYPRRNRKGQHASSFELKTKLLPDETYRAHALELHYTDEYIDEAGQLNEAGRLLATLRYPEGYARDIWLKLQPDGSVKTEVRLDMMVNTSEVVVDRLETELTQDQRDAVIEALSAGDEQQLAELVETNEALGLYAGRVIASFGPHSFSELSVEEFDELRNALSQVEAAL